MNKKCETCHYGYRLLNKDNIRKFGRYYCQAWGNYPDQEMNRPCYDYLPKDKIEDEKEKRKFILDACCGGRMFWFNKEHPNTLYMDNREFEGVACDGRKIVVKPDVVADFRNMPFLDNSFRLVVFDPPHLKRAGDKSWMKAKYGKLDPITWKEDLLAGFSECFRVLIPGGILIFKWNEEQIPLYSVINLVRETPLFGQKRGKTHWLVYMKPLEKQA